MSHKLEADNFRLILHLTVVYTVRVYTTVSVVDF